MVNGIRSRDRENVQLWDVNVRRRKNVKEIGRREMWLKRARKRNGNRTWETGREIWWWKAISDDWECHSNIRMNSKFEAKQSEIPGIWHDNNCVYIYVCVCKRMRIVLSIIFHVQTECVCNKWTTITPTMHPYSYGWWWRRWWQQFHIFRFKALPLGRSLDGSIYFEVKKK